MKKWILTLVVVMALPMRVGALSTLKLPYAKGERFVVAQGYNTLPTHVNKDAYALDFGQNGCAAYGKNVVAVAPGKAIFVGQNGYNGGYGTELIINHGDNIVSRYAHMIPGSITIAAGDDAIRRGQVVGRVGNTGLVEGNECATHPGVHLHFAMDAINANGNFSAYDPEPISGYTGITEGGWYISDNREDESEDVNNATATTDLLSEEGDVLGPQGDTTTRTMSNGAGIGNGGVSILQGAGLAAESPSASVPIAEIARDTIATTTPTSSVGAAASGTLFVQPGDDIQSGPSWYDDNWFDLGNGFSGTLNALTLKGRVSDSSYFASHIYLEEFKDSDYDSTVRQFSISDAAPFTPVMATTTFGGLSISLKPYFYYRLATIQDYQNRSVILAGTASTSVGVAMSDAFISGTGRVQSTSTFFPFIKMEGLLATSTLSPPPLTTPKILSEDFDELAMTLSISCSTSTDPDWPANPLGYEMNYSTSTTLSDGGWIAPGPIPVTIGNTYLVGIRAADGYGNHSAVATATWSFPPGFVPYMLSIGLGTADQYFTVHSTSTLQSIQLFTTNLQTSARYIESVGCNLQLRDETSWSLQWVVPSDNGVGGYSCTGAPVFSFASSSITLYPDRRYHWIFMAQTGNPSTGAAVQFYGTKTDTAGGVFGDQSLANAKFTVMGDDGVLFVN